MNEFELIQKYFQPLTEGRDALMDDAAVIQIPGGRELVVTSDTSNAGTHFMEDAAPGDIATKALRRNLSDLAAMGAKPFAYQLNLSFPQKPEEAWLKGFSEALQKDHKLFGVYCSGGDTSSIKGALSVAITAFGLVPAGQAIHRKGAKAGDHIIVTGTIGNAVTGLHVLQKKISTETDEAFIKTYYRPMPRTAHADTLRKYASAAIDISDGLAADLGHICQASGVGAKIILAPGLLSPAALKAGMKPEDLIAGGDDYELVLAVPPTKSNALMKDLTTQGLKPLKIGEFVGMPGLVVHDEKGAPMALKNLGWRHF
jgi:thiamine-monophosphate kinase